MGKPEPTGSGSVGLVAADLMEMIDTQFEDAELGHIAVVAEIKHREDDDVITSLVISSTERKQWSRAGLFEAAARMVWADDFITYTDNDEEKGD